MNDSKYVYGLFKIKNKKKPRKRRGDLMFSQRNNPYCELLQIVNQKYKNS